MSASGTVTSSSFAKALWPGVNAWYGAEYTRYQPQWVKLFDQFKSDRQWEEDVGYSGVGVLAVKPEASVVQYDGIQQGFTQRYTHIVYALGIQISKEVFDDDQYGIVGKRKTEGLASSVHETREIVGATLYDRAFNATYTYADGKELLATDHPNIAGGTWANELVVAADLSEASLEQAAIDIAGFRDDIGKKISIMPKTLIVPKDLMFEATRILKSDGRVATADNDLNALKTMGIIPEIVVSQYLSDTDAWFIRTTAKNGLKYFERWADKFDMDNDFDSFNAKFIAVSRYSFGATDPRALFGSPGA